MVAPKKTKEPLYSMPQKVSDWIERAESRMHRLQGEVDRLKQENSDLKSYKKWAEHRILRSELEN
jgi:polyhydroxyalkanoate synthesis regulator phasin